MPQDPSLQRIIKLENDSLSGSTDGKSWFLGIGINQYQHFPSLNNAVKDVKDLVRLLQEDYDLLPERTITLFDKDATRRNIIVTLDELQKKVGAEDKLLIYYSGHGHLNKAIGKGYWIPTDAEENNTADYIRNSTVREYIETFRALHTLLISDSCFSGTLFVRGASRSAEALEELASIPSRWAICSGRHDQAVYDGNPGENSPFAESIMDALRRNQSPAFNVGKLIDRVIEQTRSNYEQLPEGNPLYGVGHKGGQYVFLKKDLKDDSWAVTQKTGTIAAYLQYLEDHPRGAHAEEARRFILMQGKKQEEQPKKKKTRNVSEPSPSPATSQDSPKTKPGIQLLADRTIERIRTALHQLLTRTNEDAFVIISEEASGRFVQFAGGAENDLLFDLPTFDMDRTMISQIREVLKDYDPGLQKAKLNPGTIFNLEIDRDVELALVITSRIMIEAFGFNQDVDLHLEEN